MKLLALATSVLLAATIGVLLVPTTIAQTPGVGGTAQPSKPAPKPGQVNGSTFDEVVDNDVAQNLYSQQKGEELKTNYDAAMARLEASFDKAASSLASYASLVSSSGEYQKLNTNIYSFVDANNNLQLGRGTPQQIADQAEAVYESADVGAQVLATMQETITPVVNETLNELDQVVAARAALINANPAVPADVKHNATYQSSSFSDYVHNVADRALSTVAATIRADQDRMESNKTVIVQTLTKLLPLVASNTDKYGPDPKKWPPPPKGYFDTNYNGTESNGTVGNSNGAAGNGTGTNSGTGSGTGAGGQTNQGSTGGGAGSSPGARNGSAGTGSAQIGGAGTGSGATGTGYASQMPDDEPVIYMHIDTTTGDVVIYDPNIYKPGEAHPSQTTLTVPGDSPIPGYSQLVNAPADGTTGSTGAGNPSQSYAISADQSLGPYSDGSDLNGASFASIYNGYTVVPGQNGSAVISVPSTQVQVPSSVMTVPSDQVPTGTNQVVVPSTQVNTPSPMINMPGTQVITPSALVNMPSTQVPMPSLCGR